MRLKFRRDNLTDDALSILDFSSVPSVVQPDLWLELRFTIMIIATRHFLMFHDAFLVFQIAFLVFQIPFFVFQNEFFESKMLS